MDTLQNINALMRKYGNSQIKCLDAKLSQFLFRVRPIRHRFKYRKNFQQPVNHKYNISTYLRSNLSRSLSQSLTTIALMTLTFILALSIAMLPAAPASAAGHFILLNIDQQELNDAFTNIPSSRVAWGTLQHQHIGWNVESRRILNTALNGQQIPNREGLPPHRYLVMPANQNINNPNDSQRRYLNSATWVSRLQRPNSAGLGLRVLTPTASTYFQNGNKLEALAAQIQNGNVSLEVYYLDSLEMS